MRKNKEQKKGQESTIGKIIYGFLLFMPLIAIGVTCLISTFNMSAKQETEINYKYQTNEINNISDLIPNNIYKLSVINMPNDEEPLYVSAIYIFDNDGLYNSFTNTDEDFFTIFKSNNVINIGSDYMSEGDYTIPFVSYGINLNYVYYIVNDNNNEIVSYCERSQSLPISISDYLPIESVETHNLDTQEVFYNAVDKVTESPLFSWAENSIIYTTTNATCNALSITAPFIPLLMSYWLIVSVIYFLYDIALMLVWLIHKKIHELQESF